VVGAVDENRREHSDNGSKRKMCEAVLYRWRIARAGLVTHSMSGNSRSREARLVALLTAIREQAAGRRCWAV